MLPNFIVIGPGKTGTTWLYKCLEAHPQVELARGTKETFFFNQYYDRGLAWYENFFAGCNGAAIGEVSNNYFFSEAAAARIAQHIPQVKLIVMLRNPLDRAISAYLFRRRHGLSEGNFQDTIKARPKIITNNFFDVFLDIYLKYFRREQILVAFHDDIKTDPQALLRQVYDFIGVDSGFRPAMAGEKVFAAREPRNAAISRVMRSLALWLRERNLHKVLTWAKLNPIVLAIVNRRVNDGDRPDIPPDLREQLRELFRPHIVRVEELTGRDLSHWK